LVVRVKIPEPSFKPVMTGRRRRGVTQRSGLAVNGVALIANVLKQSETAYILFFALNINVIPLAPRDLRSPSMNSGDYAC
jgi:hypothetical protein